ncbi:MAG: IS200/IS605 family transposase [Oceanipulchritudo sp.]
MSSTYLDLNYHLVFSTKHRERWILTEWRPRLHAYLGGIIRGLNGVPLSINGVEDHVHLLIGLRSTHCLADFMRELKKASSGWVRDETGLSFFAWQKGYAAFTVSCGFKGTVRKYILNQERHHRAVGFEEELITLLREAEIEYDPRYLD